MNQTYKKFFTASDPSLSDIFSLTDNQTDVFMSGQPGATVGERKRGSISPTLNMKTDTS